MTEITREQISESLGRLETALDSGVLFTVLSANDSYQEMLNIAVKNNATPMVADSLRAYGSLITRYKVVKKQ